ncbi:MAG: hypothetical protein HZA51_17465 [Planctomycetes bacterium]|nr:hypothetical protein [Planctomycetota bacterium]
MTDTRPGPGGDAGACQTGSPWRDHVLWLALSLVAVLVIDGARIRLTEWEVTPSHNINLAEAVAWDRGTFELEPPQREAARVDGRLLNAFPPAFTFVSFVALKVSKLVGAQSPFPSWMFRVLVGGFALIIPYGAFARATAKPWQAAVLTLAFLLGTPMLVMLSLCRIGGFFEVNHVLACCGLFLMTSDLLGCRRGWPSIIGLVLAFWSRQLTLLYLPAMVWFAWKSNAGERRRRIGMVAYGAVIAIGGYMALNAAKFGSPFNTGYVRIYDGRDDPIAQRARAGLFRPEYAAENFQFMMLEPPGLRVSSAGVERAMNDFGAGIFWTCPLLIAVITTARQWWRDAARRALMVCSFVVVGMLLMYHNTGWRQPGYYRFALDFIPIWMAVIAPYLWTRRSMALVAVCVLWSVWYFRFITFNNLAWVGIPG